MVYPDLHHTQERDGLKNSDRKSPSDVYRFNGEGLKPKNEDGNVEDAIFLQLFKEQEAAAVSVSANKFSKVLPQLPSNSQAHPCKSEPSWLEMNYLSKMEGYPFPSPSSFVGTGNTYVGGPNVTPPYHKITGEFLKSKTNDSSSTSGMDSSPTQSQNGRNDSNCRIKDGQKEAIRLGKDEKIAREAGIRFNVKQDIVNSPMDECNDMLSKEELSEEQLNICRDIRSRGKNKVAAQNCRKRKIEQIDELKEKLDEAKRRQYQLQTNHEKLLSSYSSEASKLTRLTDLVLTHHNKNPHHHIVQVVGEEVKILPKSAVAEKERIPKPVSSLRRSYQAESYNTGSQHRGLYNHGSTDHCDRRGWD